MFFEFRTYHVRPGCLAQLVGRFDKANVPIFKRLGIDYVGFWTVMVGQSSHHFHYMLRWKSLEERGEKWSAFVRDPEWVSARDASDIHGPLVQDATNSFLEATAFSPLQ